MGRNTMRSSVNNAMRQRLFTEYLNEQKLNKMELEIYYFEDWVNNMLNDSDYTEWELMGFEEYYQNLLTFEENTEIFINYLKNIEQNEDTTN